MTQPNEKRFRKLTIVIFCAAIIWIVNVISINVNTIAYAKIPSASSFPAAVDPKTSGLLPSIPPHKTNMHAVRITSPVKGQQVSVGKNLVVSGISTSPATSATTPNSSCFVTVIVNGIKPYQNATALGPKGSSDYSKWQFTLIPKYTTTKEGPNKLTAKFSCGNNLSQISYYSVNVTGVKGASLGSNSSRASIASHNGTSTPKVSG
jgi:hypothetical protein